MLSAQQLWELSLAYSQWESELPADLPVRHNKELDTRAEYEAMFVALPEHTRALEERFAPIIESGIEADDGRGDEDLIFKHKPGGHDHDQSDHGRKGHRNTTSAFFPDVPGPRREHVDAVQRWHGQFWDRNGVISYPSGMTISLKDAAWVPADSYRSYEEWREEVEVAMSDDIPTRNLYVRADAEVLHRVLDDGRFLNQFETGDSGGFYGPDRIRDWQQTVLGIDADAEPSERPIFGYAAHGELDGLNAAHYGNVIVRLKDSLKARTTITVGDSLNKTGLEGAPTLLASPMLEPSAESFPMHVTFTEAGLEVTDPAYDLDGWEQIEYVETQVYGGVTVDDIAEVVIEPRSSFGGNAFDAMMEVEHLVARLDEAGIPWRLSPLDGFTLERLFAGEVVGFDLSHLVEKHLPGRHDQKDHGTKGGVKAGSFLDLAIRTKRRDDGAIQGVLTRREFIEGHKAIVENDLVRAYEKLKRLNRPVNPEDREWDERIRVLRELRVMKDIERLTDRLKAIEHLERKMPEFFLDDPVEDIRVRHGVVVKHLKGQHNQKDHGRKQGAHEQLDLFGEVPTVAPQRDFQQRLPLEVAEPQLLHPSEVRDNAKAARALLKRYTEERLKPASDLLDAGALDHFEERARGHIQWAAELIRSPGSVYAHELAIAAESSVVVQEMAIALEAQGIEPETAGNAAQWFIAETAQDHLSWMVQGDEVSYRRRHRYQDLITGSAAMSRGHRDQWFAARREHITEPWLQNWADTALRQREKVVRDRLHSGSFGGALKLHTVRDGWKDHLRQLREVMGQDPRMQLLWERYGEPVTLAGPVSSGTLGHFDFGFEQHGAANVLALYDVPNLASAPRVREVVDFSGDQQLRTLRDPSQQFDDDGPLTRPRRSDASDVVLLATDEEIRATWSASNDRTGLYTYYHEYGHYLHGQLAREAGSTDLTKNRVPREFVVRWRDAVLDQVRWTVEAQGLGSNYEHVALQHILKGHRFAEGAISRYGMTSPAEGFAETFAAVMHPDYDRSRYAERWHPVLEYIERIVREATS